MPQLSIGLPVYNGERFLEDALDSILGQTFEDFELIISDNASTDRTGEICQAYADKDRRIRYCCNEKNLGAVKNFNRTVELATGRYFRWAPADDLMARECLERCIEVMESNPDVLLCHTKVRFIDENGRFLRDFDDLLDFRSSSPRRRFREYLFRSAGGWNAVCGVVRVAELRKTPLIGRYPGADQVLLGELVLRGKIYQIPERLFSRRRHPQQSWQANRGRKAIANFCDTSKTRKLLLLLFPFLLIRFFGYIRSIQRVPLHWSDRLPCYAYILGYEAKQVVWHLRKKIRMWRARLKYSYREESI